MRKPTQAAPTSAVTPPQVAGEAGSWDFAPPHGMLLRRADRGRKARLPVGCGGVAAQFPFSGPMGVAMSREVTGLGFRKALTVQSAHPFARVVGQDECRLSTQLGRRPTSRANQEADIQHWGDPQPSIPQLLLNA